MNFSLKKKQLKFSCTYQALSLCEILKKFLESIQSYQNVPFLSPKSPICPERFFLVQTIIITFIYLLALFIVQNFKKFLQWIQSYEMYHFWAHNGPFAPNKFFLQKIINIIFIYQLAPLHYAKLKKKILTVDPEF